MGDQNASRGGATPARPKIPKLDRLVAGIRFVGVGIACAGYEAEDEPRLFEVIGIRERILREFRGAVST